MAATPEELEQVIDRAISDALGSTGQMVTRWLAVVEVVDEDGDRGLWTFAAAGTKRWDTLGMLADAQLREQVNALRGED